MEPDLGTGGTIVSSQTGHGSNVETKDTTHTDSIGQVVETERSASAKDDQGNASETTSTVDYQTGEVTITTVSTDGTNIYTHTSITDANGNIISDDSTVGPAGGTGRGSGGGDDGGGDDGGGDDGGGRGEDDSSDGDDDRDDPPEPHFGGGDGPSFPGDTLGKILDAYWKNPGGGGDDGEEIGEGMPGVIGERARRVIAAAHSSSGEGGSGTGDLGDGDGVGAVSFELRLPGPAGAVDDWGDRPHPQFLVALTSSLNARGLALGAIAGQLREILGPGS